MPGNMGERYLLGHERCAFGGAYLQQVHVEKPHQGSALRVRPRS
jgi:hypothetical protein